MPGSHLQIVWSGLAPERLRELKWTWVPPKFSAIPLLDFPEERAPFLDDNFAAFAFKRMDLPLAVARFTAFLVAFAFAFAFVAMSRGEL